ncbi:DUF742 domain-containing protein [Streptomyces solisilvae]|uniref:DUF742 domain-containing protein n=1 Tax=Streptomyces malaysiensis TaxID=92644 RepID=UPI0036C696E5
MTVRGDRFGLVRSHVPTEGRAEPARAGLDEASLLCADPTMDRTSLSAHEQSVMELVLPAKLSVVDVSACLKQPVTVTKIIAASLVESGHLLVRSPVPTQQREDTVLLERILSGLHKL